MRTNCSLRPDEVRDGEVRDDDECVVCIASIAPVASRKRLYPAPRATNFTWGSVWARLGSKISGNCPRMARASGFDGCVFECNGVECDEDPEKVRSGEAGS